MEEQDLTLGKKSAARYVSQPVIILRSHAIPIEGHSIWIRRRELMNMLRRVQQSSFPQQTKSVECPSLLKCAPVSTSNLAEVRHEFIPFAPALSVALSSWSTRSPRSTRRLEYGVNYSMAAESVREASLAVVNCLSDWFLMVGQIMLTFLPDSFLEEGSSCPEKAEIGNCQWTKHSAKTLLQAAPFGKWECTLKGLTRTAWKISPDRMYLAPVQRRTFGLSEDSAEFDDTSDTRQFISRWYFKLSHGRSHTFMKRGNLSKGRSSATSIRIQKCDPGESSIDTRAITRPYYSRQQDPFAISPSSKSFSWPFPHCHSQNADILSDSTFLPRQECSC